MFITPDGEPRQRYVFVVKCPVKKNTKFKRFCLILHAVTKRNNSFVHTVFGILGTVQA